MRLDAHLFSTLYSTIFKKVSLLKKWRNVSFVLQTQIIIFKKLLCWKCGFMSFFFSASDSLYWKLLFFKCCTICILLATSESTSKKWLFPGFKQTVQFVKASYQKCCSFSSFFCSESFFVKDVTWCLYVHLITPLKINWKLSWLR